MLVGAIEANPGEGRVSVDAPVGPRSSPPHPADVVHVASPGGELRFECSPSDARRRREARRRYRTRPAGCRLRSGGVGGRASNAPQQQLAAQEETEHEGQLGEGDPREDGRPADAAQFRRRAAASTCRGSPARSRWPGRGRHGAPEDLRAQMIRWSAPPACLGARRRGRTALRRSRRAGRSLRHRAPRLPMLGAVQSLDVEVGVRARS